MLLDVEGGGAGGGDSTSDSFHTYIYTAPTQICTPLIVSCSLQANNSLLFIDVHTVVGSLADKEQWIFFSGSLIENQRLPFFHCLSTLTLVIYVDSHNPVPAICNCNMQPIVLHLYLIFFIFWSYKNTQSNSNIMW